MLECSNLVSDLQMGLEITYFEKKIVNLLLVGGSECPIYWTPCTSGGNWVQNPCPIYWTPCIRGELRNKPLPNVNLSILVNISFLSTEIHEQN